MLSLILAEKILSLFLIMAMGFALVRSGVMKTADIRGISLANLYIISPCMIISAFQIDMTTEVWQGFVLALIAGSVIQVIFIGLAWLCGKSKLLHFDAVEKASTIYSNAGNLIIPLVVMILGQDKVIYCTAYIVFQTIFMWSHGKSLLRGTRGIDLREILLSVNMIAVYIGIALFVTGIHLPDPVNVAITGVGDMVGPSSMMVTGMIMGGIDFKQLLSFKRLPLVTLFRMIVFPLVALAILKFTPLASLAPNGTTVLLITLLAASGPSASTINQMAQIYDRDAAYASSINVVTILACIVTMPLMVFLYQL